MAFISADMILKLVLGAAKLCTKCLLQNLGSIWVCPTAWKLGAQEPGQGEEKQGEPHMGSTLHCLSVQEKLIMLSFQYRTIEIHRREQKAWSLALVWCPRSLALTNMDHMDSYPPWSSDEERIKQKLKEGLTRTPNHSSVNG